MLMISSAKKEEKNECNLIISISKRYLALRYEKIYHTINWKDRSPFSLASAIFTGIRIYIYVHIYSDLMAQVEHMRLDIFV